MLLKRPKSKPGTVGWGLVKGSLRLMGPAFLVSVSHVDPGDWATSIEGGSRFGTKLVWVIVVSHLVAIQLQNLSARLGLVTGSHLAQVCRQQYPRIVCWLLWMLSEVSIIALDLTMVLGTALGLSLLFRIPVLPCILVSGLDTLVLVLLPQLGTNKAERLTAGLMGLIVLCFVIELFIVKPPLAAIAGGLSPSLDRDSLYTAVSLLGANVMPHNFYLHSALVAKRAHQGESVEALCTHNFVDIAFALGIALLINIAVTVVASETFNKHGIVVNTLQDAHDMMEQILSSNVAPAVFGLAILCAGQLSTFTGTISGQVVLQGFLNINISTWLRRLLTRTAAVIPAALLQLAYGDQGTYQLLVMVQVVLALALPFTLVPLIKATSSKQLMGAFRNSPASTALSWLACGVIFCANLLLLLHWLFPDEDDDEDLLDTVLTMASQQPLLQKGADWNLEAAEAICLELKLVGLGGLVVATSAALALLAWMICMPFGADEHDPFLTAKPAKALLERAVGKDMEGPSSLSKDADEERVTHPATLAAEGLHLTSVAERQQHKPAESSIAVQSPPRLEEVMPAAKVPSEETWEDRASDLLSRDIEDIQKDLLQAPASPLAMPPTVAPILSEPTATSTPWRPNFAQPPKPAMTLAPGKMYEIAQGERREVARILATFWSEMYDMHGNAVSQSALAEAVLAEASTGLWLQVDIRQPSGAVAPEIGAALQAVAELSGGRALLDSHFEGSAQQIELAMSQFWADYSDRQPAMQSTGSQSRAAGSYRNAEDTAAICKVHICFAFWTMLRALELCQQEPRPELWGRYALSLNRLQASFFSDRHNCLVHEQKDMEAPGILRTADLVRSSPALCEHLLHLVRSAEQNVNARKGPAGTAAGNVAFPKGKEIILSLLKRYKRALGSWPANHPFGRRANLPLMTALAGMSLFGCIALYGSSGEAKSRRLLRIALD